MFAMIVPSTISSASNLEISNNADFSTQTNEFSGGQTIFVRMQSSFVAGKKSQLNLRDNQYKLLNSFRLEREGSYYTAVLAVPYDAGYYSLEAQVESESSSATSVRTIKIGSPASASVKVNVNSQKSGQSLDVLGEHEEGADQNLGRDMLSPNPNSEPSVINDTFSQESTNGGLFSTALVIVKEVFDFLWPFN